MGRLRSSAFAAGGFIEEVGTYTDPDDDLFASRGTGARKQRRMGSTDRRKRDDYAKRGTNRDRRVEQRRSRAAVDQHDDWDYDGFIDWRDCEL